jgi:hypothetical protein
LIEEEDGYKTTFHAESESFDIERLFSQSKDLTFVKSSKRDASEGTRRPNNLEEFLNIFGSAADALHAIEEPNPQPWLQVSNKMVYIPGCHLEASEPFLGIVLEGRYLKWKTSTMNLPALFMPLLPGPAGRALVFPDLKHPDTYNLQGIEEAAYNLSPSINATDFTDLKDDPVIGEMLKTDVPYFLFSASVKEFRSAIKYYHDSLGGNNRLLSYFHNKSYDETEHLMIVRIKMPRILSKDNFPVLKSPVVKLKVSVYCREYLCFKDY